MPIEIYELVVKANIAEPGEQPMTPTPSPVNDLPDNTENTMVLDQLIDILKRKKER